MLLGNDFIYIFGRILDANGSVLTFVTPFLYYLNSKNAKMGISIFELSEVIQWKFLLKGDMDLHWWFLLLKEGQGCISLKSIAEENNLSDLYLEQLVGPLRNAGLIRSVRGAKGGYQLRVPAEEISAGDIIRLLEGPITFVESIESEPPAQKQLWIRMRDAVRDVLDNTTLKYLAEYVDTSEDLDGYMFYI